MSADISPWASKPFSYNSIRADIAESMILMTSSGGKNCSVESLGCNNFERLLPTGSINIGGLSL